MLNALSPATNALLPLLLLLHLLSSPLPAASFTSPALLPPRSPRSPALLPLRAVSVLARRAKEAEVAALLASLPVTDPLPALLGTLPSLLSARPPPAFPSRLRDSLTKRRGNLSIVAEYRLKGTGLAELGGSAAPAIVSKLIRVGGAAAAAVMADPRMGGCDYPDVAAFVAENETARGGVPGPLPVVSSDLVVTEAQVARAKLAGAAAVTLSAAALGKELLKTLLEAAAAFGLEAVVFCGSEEEVVGAVGLGATIVCIAAEEDVEVKKEWRERSIPEGVCAVCLISSAPDALLTEVEEAWRLRDAGFNAAWVCDCLYKAGADPAEQAGAIIGAMKAKSSVKWFSAKGKSGRGEGAKEYLGDIMM
ncbi:hypothetical protein TeGR_g6565 [Tetraparma gracilis]|uniref:indole-3-glycerol-phosphate synthase n=1 Tax=Tetraparma gracilis TaxID=2962635 RepID=A0ABQ6M6P7_9STRA|nr:hypothetical protein TeGR_g6565 [Tetraparma gracilis]